MSIFQAITDFAGAVDGLRAELKVVNDQLQDFENRRRSIVNAMPHSDEIAGVFLRGLDGLTRDFEQQFASHLRAFFAEDRGAISSAFRGGSADLLRIEANKPELGTVISRNQSGSKADINGAVLAYLLRDKIAEEIHGLIDRLCPSASSGMKSADRQAALQAVDAEIAQLKEKKAELLDNLETARSCFSR